MIKYLGVTIDHKLTFKKHIQEKCNNATRVLNMLRRNLHFAPTSVKCKAYLTSVRPILEYASVCWNPSSQKINRSIEIVQNKAAKFVTNCYPKKGKEDEFSVTRLIKQLGWDSLEERRSKARLSMIYKIINNHVIIKPDTLPKPNRSTRTCNERNVGAQNQLLEPNSKFINSGNTCILLPGATTMEHSCVT